MSGTSVSAFSADALTTNQAGRLTDQQRQACRGQDRSFRKNELTGALGAIVFGISVGTCRAASSRRLTAPSSRTSEAAAAGRAQARTTFHVAGKNFDVPRGVYQAAPEAGMVRVYFLPRSKTVVNLEQLPDRPLPAGAASSPTEVVQALATGLRSHDLTQEAEAMAQIATLKKSIDQAAAVAAIPPPAGEVDPRPLAEAIVGTWQTGPISVTFAAGGTMTTTLPAGQGQPSHWSVDSGGQLHAQFGGRDQVGEAWVAGDTLTIKEGGEGRQFQRASAG